VAKDPDGGDLVPRQQRVHAGERVRPELSGGQRQLLGGVGAMAANVEREDVEACRIQDLGIRQRAIARRFPAVDKQDGGPGLAAARRDPPGRELHPANRADADRLEREADEARVVLGRVAVRVARPGPVRLRESPRGDRPDGERGGQAEAAAGHARNGRSGTPVDKLGPWPSAIPTMFSASLATPASRRSRPRGGASRASTIPT
jgi:hypothetical protein